MKHLHAIRQITIGQRRIAEAVGPHEHPPFEVSRVSGQYRKNREQNDTWAMRVLACFRGN